MSAQGNGVLVDKSNKFDIFPTLASFWGYMATSDTRRHTPPSVVDAIRRFNRFYTRQIGVLNEGHLESPFSLTEVRLLYELAHRSAPTASELVRDLQLDPGYVSRVLRGFETRGLVRRVQSPMDGRQHMIELTSSGRDAFGDLDARASRDIAALIDPLDATAQRRLISAMHTIESLFESPNEPAIP